MKFESLGLTRPILNALAEQGYQTPTPIQEQAIPAALAGRDVLGCARTGTGKTCAFAAPILQRLSAAPAKGRPIRALILTPTRELAIQIQECFEAYGAHLKLKSVVIFGGVGQNPQVEAIQSGCDILVATPGRLEDLHGQGLIDVSRLEIFVLDEADRMLDMGFIHDVRKILTWLPEKKQTLFFSATMPDEITKLVNSLLHDPVRIAVDPVSSPVEVIEQSVYRVDKGNKTKLLVQLLEEKHIPSALVFTRTKHGANRVAQDLVKAGVTAAAIHGNKSQTARQAALSGFKDGSVRVLVATDIAARGLDIEDLACVFNYNLPEVPETYVHRIGRTGRAGKDGIAVSFCDYSELPLLKDIEKLIGRHVPEVKEHPFPMQIFEAPVKDAKGRVVNAEDAEARAAARAKKAEKARPAESAKAEPAPEAPAAPKKEKRKKNAHTPERAAKVPVPEANVPKAEAKPAPAPKAEPEAEREPSFGDIHLPGERRYKRPERKPLSALDEIAPPLSADEMPEPLYGVKRTGRLRNTFFTPEEQARYGGEPEPFEDSTTRLLAPKKKAKAEPVKAEQPASKKKAKAEPAKAEQPASKKKAKAEPAKAEQPASKKKAKAEPAKAEQPASKKKAKAEPVKAEQPASKKKAKAEPAKAEQPASKKEAKAEPVKTEPVQTELPGSKKKRRHGSDRPPQDQRSIYGAHKKDSTEQEGSLMKPYYLSDDD